MDAKLNWSLERGAGTTDSEELWLRGLPPLETYLDHLREHAAGEQDGSRSAWLDEWRAANDYYYELAEKEAGLADQIEIHAVDRSLQPLIDELSEDSRFRRVFDNLPTRFAMVELDKLIVSQRHIDLHVTHRLRQRLEQSSTPEDLFRFCLPIGGHEPPVQARRLGSRRFMFWSQSADFRFHEGARGGIWIQFPQCHPIRQSAGAAQWSSPRLHVARYGHHPCALHRAHSDLPG